MNIHFPKDYNNECTKALRRAVAGVPAYQAWRSRDPGAGVDVENRYSALPILTKADIRLHTFEGLVPAGRSAQDGIRDGVIELVRTSGTTDDQVTLIWNQPWWNASEKASWQLNSAARRAATGRHREAILTSPICTGVLSKNGELVPMADRRLKRFLYLNELVNPADWPAGYLDRMIDELAEFRPAVLEGNPTLLAKLARHINVSGRKVFNPGLIILTFELPSRVHLREIRKAFKSPVASSYGSTEAGYVFMECECGKFHQNSRFCRVDLQPFKRQYGLPPETGRLLVTTFRNKWFSIVRFNVGDVVRFLKAGRCPCGRNSGVTAVMEGRAKDITFRTDGTAVTVNRLDEAVSRLAWLREYQLEQASPTQLVFRAVAGVPANRKIEAEAKRVLGQLYGRGLSVEVGFENIILPENSGKHRLAKTSYPVDVEGLFE